MATKPRVTFDGRQYAVRSSKTPIPDLAAMSRFAAIQWLIRYTYPKGTNGHRPAPNLRGLTLTVRVR